MRAEVGVHRRRLSVVIAMAVMGTALFTPVANADLLPLCLAQTEGCVLERYDTPFDAGILDDNTDLTAVSLGPPEGNPTADTDNFAFRRSGSNGAGVTFQGLNSAKHGKTGVDLVLYDPNVSPKYYLPCKNTADDHHNACVNPASSAYYWKDGTFAAGTSNPYPVGILVGNSTTNTNCPNTCQHNWGKRVYALGAEFYVKQPDGATTDLNYVRTRFTSLNEYNTVSGNGYHMSPSWGVITTKSVSDSGVARLSGKVYSTRVGGVGVPAAASRAYFSIFQKNNVSTALTSTGRYLSSFGVGYNVTGGAYTSGAVYAALFDIKVIDTETGKTCVFANRQLNSPSMTADFYLDEPYFGRGSTDSRCSA